MGWNYPQSADWLNDICYTTPRGKKFGNAHTHYFVKNKKREKLELQITINQHSLTFDLDLLIA